MAVTNDQLDQFNQFARVAISEDLLAIKASLREMQNGDHGVLAEDHIREMRKKYGLPAEA